MEVTHVSSGWTSEGGGFGDDDEEDERRRRKAEIKKANKVGAIILTLWKIDSEIGSESAQQTARNRFLGKASRNYITGQVRLENAQTSKNFIIVDLWTRDSVTKSIDDIIQDDFLFKPKVLNVRNWIWHDKYRHAVEDHTISKMTGLGIFEILKRRVDEYGGHDWSPIIILAPMLMVLPFTYDLMVLLLGIGLLVVTAGLSSLCNHHNVYWAQRHITLLFRLGFFVFVLASMASSGGGIAIIGFSVTLIILMVDFVVGDIFQLLGKREGSYYEVLHILRNQVMVCWWNGPEHLMSQYKLPEKVCGIAPWNQVSDWKRIVLLAVVQGILCELEPFEAEDKKWFENEFYRSGCGNGDWSLPFCGCDVFDPRASDIHKLKVIEAQKENPNYRDDDVRPVQPYVSPAQLRAMK